MTSDILSSQVKETVSIVLELLLEEHAGQTTASFPTTRKMLPFARCGKRDSVLEEGETTVL